MKIPKKRLGQAVARFRRQFGDQPTRAIHEVLAADVVTALVKEEVGSYRERVYPPLTSLGLFIGQALSPDGACQDAVARNLSERRARGEAGCSLSTGPYCRARQRLPLGLIRRLGEAVGETLERSIPRNWKWRGRPVKLVDGTTVSMPDTPVQPGSLPTERGAEAGTWLSGGDADGGSLVGHRGGAALGIGTMPGQAHWRAGAASHADAVSGSSGRGAGRPLPL